MDNTRELWVKTLCKIANPVFQAISQDSFKDVFPIKAQKGENETRAKYTHLEAIDGKYLSSL